LRERKEGGKALTPFQLKIRGGGMKKEKEKKEEKG